MLRKSYKRKVLAFAFMLLISFCFLGFLKTTTSNKLVTSVDLNTANGNPNQKTAYNAEIYVPSITITKGTNFNSSDCSGFSIDYTVENTSDAGEVFINVQVTDADIGGLSPIFVSGDDNNNNRLDPGEKWNYTTNYGITQDDINNDSIVTQLATVVADVEGQGIQVMDDTSSDAPTIIDLTPCQIASIGLIKDWSYVDLDGGNPPCAENFLYTFEVLNTGNLDLQNLVLDDPLLGGEVPGPTPLSDVGNDGVLSPGEIWEYQALYSADLLASGTIINQAEVTAETRQGAPVSDLSDDDSYLENDETPAPYDEVCDGAFARIGLIKTVSDSLDNDNDNCDDTIQYTFTVQNVREAPLEEIVLMDPLLGGEVTNRTDDGDGDDILAPGETWIYQGEYMVTPEDIIEGTVTNQALVRAKLVGFDIFLFDYSDDNSFDQNDDTVEQVGDYCSTPSIGLLKQAGSSGFLVDLDGDGCLESLHYEFTVTNTGGVDLDEVVLNDLNFNEDIDGPIGDTNDDGELSVGETWKYNAYYPLLQADVDRGFVDNQATVSAEEVGTEDVYSDDSDHTSFDEDRPTRASTIAANVCPAEANIGLIKTVPSGNLIDLDSDGCPETIRYLFTLENTASIDLREIVITDENINGPITGPTNDTGQDNILSIGETWSFEALYSVTEQNTIDGLVRNQARVTAIDTFYGNMVSDFSDHSSNEEDRETETTFNETVCFAEAEIALIKAASTTFGDLNNDGCAENIPYVFTIRNTGAIPLQQVVLSDLLISQAPIEGPLVGSDINGDEVLSPTETWTYQALYPITEQNIQDTFVRNQAFVTAVEQGTNNTVSDDSDDNSFDENDETVTSVVGTCPAEASMVLTKSAALQDEDGDGCPETIQYTFTVDNTGAINLHQVAIADDILPNGITGPLNNSDIGGDNVLSTTETWMYEAIYTITQTDFDEGLVRNRAQVSALEVVTNNFVEATSEEIIAAFAAFCEKTVDADFEIFNGITPNGDGINDFFEIKGIENYPNNNLKVFNRWGVLVFETENYGTGNVLFTGQSDGRATIAKERALPTGTYFYSLKFIGDNPGEEVYSGYLYISRD